MEIKKRFGQNVKHFRLLRGWSQEKLALNADLDRTYIPSIEKGERNVSIEVVEKLAVALEIDISSLFNQENLK